MRSSISASNPVRAASLLLAGCVLVALGVEAIARVGFDRVSKIQRRMADEYRVARAIGRDGAAQAGHLLVVGNSLLDEDVRFDDLRAALGTEWDARRFVVEQTFYLDWYYGLRRLFHDGARPDVVVLMLSTRQWVRSDIRGDYSAHYLMTAVDVPAAARDLGLNATQTTNLALSNVSKFWGARAELRNFVLGRLMPDLGRLMDFSSVVDTRTIVDDEVAPVAQERIARLKALTDANGATLVILLPAVLNPQDGAAGLVRAASAVGVPTLRPVESGAFAPQLYRDAGFHLNQVGASEFTARLIPALRQQLAAARSTAQIQLQRRTN
jgi:hypothetical protein